MKKLLKTSTLLLALTTCISAIALPAFADSTADLILNLKCQGGYNINVWKKRASGELLYRSTGSGGNLNLGKGSSKATEGVKVYKFRNNNYEYWAWDGTLDSQQAGTLEVYKNNRLLMRQVCKKP
jgi:hypothetical protein